jgi:hypothetical protein
MWSSTYAPQSCVGQVPRQAFQHDAVSRQCDVIQFLDRSQALDQARYARPDQWLAPRNADFSHPQADKSARQVFDFVVGHQLDQRQEYALAVQGVGRHAIGAAEIAAVDNGYAQFP